MPDVEYPEPADRQIELGDQRFEAGEIEAALRRQAGVANALVRAWQMEGETALVAYIEAGVHWRRLADVRDALRRELPDVMVPRAWVVLDELPLTPSGQMDWAVLPEPGAGDFLREYVAPRDSLERQVAEIWQEVFVLERVGIHDDFYELGGHSLLAVQIATRLEALVRAPVPVAQVLGHPTVMQLVAWATTRAEQAGGNREPGHPSGAALRGRSS